MLYEYPPTASGLATQGDLMYRGLKELGVDVHAVHFQSDLEKEWYYRWFKPDLAVGIGFWGYAPHLILQPQRFGVQPVPWLVADGYIANYQDELNNLPLILVTSNWVREVYIRDGIRPEIIEVLPVGCDTNAFIPRTAADPRLAGIRDSLGIRPDQLMILTIGGDTASKGGREVMEALARIDSQVPDWRYVCKGWDQDRTSLQNRYDLELAVSLGIEKKIIFNTSYVSRNCMPYLMAACDIYAGPSRLEGFGMPHVEAGACAKPVLAVNAMAFQDTLVDEKTALLAGIAQENWISETTIYDDPHDKVGHHHIFDPPRIADYRASVDDIADRLLRLMQDSNLRHKLGAAGRDYVSRRYGYRDVAKELLSIVSRHASSSGKRSSYTRAEPVKTMAVSE